MKSLSCPQCGLPIPESDVDSRRDLLTCRHCGTTASLSRTLSIVSPRTPLPQTLPRGLVAEPEMTDYGMAMVFRWHPPKSGLVVLLLFALVWFSAVGWMTYACWHPSADTVAAGTKADWVAPSVFGLGGVLVFTPALLAAATPFTLRMGSGKGRLRTGLLFRHWHTFAYNRQTFVRLLASPPSRRRGRSARSLPSVRIVLETPGEKPVHFGSNMPRATAQALAILVAHELR